MAGWSTASVLLDIAFSAKVLLIASSHIYLFAVEPLRSYQLHRKARLPILAFGRGDINFCMTFGLYIRHTTYYDLADNFPR